MAGRYLVTGSQLGELIALIKTNPEDANKKVNAMIENQFVGNSNRTIERDVAEVYWEEN